MKLSLFTADEIRGTTSSNFRAIKNVEISELCAVATSKGIRVFVNYYEGTIFSKDCRLIEILEHGGTILSQRFRFDPTLEETEPAADNELRSCGRWNGIEKQKLIDLVAEECPWKSK